MKATVKGKTTWIGGLAVALLSNACSSNPSLVPSLAPPTIDTAPDDAVATFTVARGVPGLAVAVVNGGETVYSKVAGVRKRGSDLPVTYDDAFTIGSNTKGMTALIAGTVVDAGQITWDTTVGEVLTGTIDVGAQYRSVTLAQLLSHRSGLPRGLPDSEWSTFRTNDSAARPVESERRRLATMALALPPVSESGTVFAYSNLGYVVAGLMLEVRTGQSWETLIKGRLFDPLGMSHAGFGAPATPSTIDAPWGHDPAPVAPGPLADNPPAFGPAGTVHANLDDMLHYVRIFFDDGLGPNGPIVLASTLAEIETPRPAVIPQPSNGYGYGWGISLDPAGRNVLSHSGTNRAFYSSIVVIPALRAAVIVMINVGDPVDDGEAATRMGEINTYFLGHFLHCDGRLTAKPPAGAALEFLLGALCLHRS